MANLDGSDAVQLSDFHALTGSPQWSPDGRRIAFDSRVSGAAALYLVDPSTALPRRIFTNGIPALRANLVGGREMDLLYVAVVAVRSNTTLSIRWLSKAELQS